MQALGLNIHNTLARHVQLYSPPPPLENGVSVESSFVMGSFRQRIGLMEGLEGVDGVPENLRIF